MKPMFRIGERVQIRLDLTKNEQDIYNVHGLNGDMMNLRGEVVTIHRVNFEDEPRQGLSDGYDYRIEEDGGSWCWTADCFVKYEPEIDLVALLDFL